ncbi:MAG: hypothetical protein KQH53_11385 [Desulfarculaceae bacterium]|nr:hypothetical protein [Desulfarculaceae bacterium]
MHRLFWMLLVCLPALLLGPSPAGAAPPRPFVGINAEVTVVSGKKLPLKGLCVAERCAICRDLAAAGACRNPGFEIKYMESDTFLPLDRVQALEFHGRARGSVNYYHASVTIWGGRKFMAKVLVQKQVLPVIMCGLNDIGTVSCLPLGKIKSFVVR